MSLKNQLHKQNDSLIVLVSSRDEVHQSTAHDQELCSGIWHANNDEYVHATSNHSCNGRRPMQKSSEFENT